MTASPRPRKLSIALLPAAPAYRVVALLLVWLLATTGALAQTTLTGRALDQQKQEALPFANVVLKATGPETKVVQAVLTDENGRFTLPAVKPGSYELQVLQLGYTPHTQVVQVAAATPALDLGTMALPAAAQRLDEVVVMARKPLLEQKPDRVVMNVDNSLLAAGNSAYDILAMAPAVQLVDGRLTFRGKGNVLILLNGKRLPRGTSLETVLASLPGDQIERIELISNPSAKYDADATGGVIEIYTKRSKELGWTANVGANFRQGQRTGAGLTGGLRVSSPKLDFAASGSFSRREGFERGTGSRTLYEGRQPAATLGQVRNLNKVSRDGSFNSSLNYHPSARTTVGFDVDWLPGSLAGAGIARADLAQAAGLTTSNIQEEVMLKQAFTNYTLFYKHTLDSLGSNLLLSGNYATYRSEQQQSFDQEIAGPGNALSRASSFRNFIPATYHIFTGSADYAKTWNPTTRLESGLKYTDTRNQSRQLAESLRDGAWQPEALTPFSQVGYQEQVAAGYFNLNHTIGRLSLQGGLRTEHTRYTVVSGIDSSYFNLFPNVRADYKASNNYTASLGYARNIQRPAYESLIPFERFLDTYTTMRGNASLRPEYAHSFSWNNLYQSYSLQLNYTQTTGAISSVYLYDAPNLRFVNTTQNLRQRHLATATLTAPLTPTKWWSMNNSASVIYQQLRFPDPLDAATPYTKSQTNFTASSDNTFTIGKGWSTRVYGLYNSGSFDGLFDIGPYSYVSVGVKKSFWEKRASLNLTVVDLFYQLNPRVSSSVVPFVSSQQMRNDTRQVRLSFTYNFGKTDLKSKRLENNSNAAERGRLGM
ncbi:TonB-dependent receptor domain-containing protein [Hymenobacter arizonensis]|uniref:TonB-dependent Receptor Plug Domain n=1 Tax=Hymenobacter arizonensis TaxID=1227077 RepID=A0A1I5X7S9_HYMAR|nr:outer membrane beta-barrel family protein [Hymenobacter arizonensis]SFQ28053.1 TonB-dependent Receptor Plug Domain [Hymenobacter arizonensis]